MYSRYNGGKKMEKLITNEILSVMLINNGSDFMLSSALAAVYANRLVCLILKNLDSQTFKITGRKFKRLFKKHYKKLIKDFKSLQFLKSLFHFLCVCQFGVNIPWILKTIRYVLECCVYGVKLLLAQIRGKKVNFWKNLGRLLSDIGKRFFFIMPLHVLLIIMLAFKLKFQIFIKSATSLKVSLKKVMDHAFLC